MNLLVVFVCKPICSHVGFKKISQKPGGWERIPHRILAGVSWRPHTGNQRPDHHHWYYMTYSFRSELMAFYSKGHPHHHHYMPLTSSLSSSLYIYHYPNHHHYHQYHHHYHHCHHHIYMNVAHIYPVVAKDARHSIMAVWRKLAQEPAIAMLSTSPRPRSSWLSSTSLS